MREIILAGGTGSRLCPASLPISKILLQTALKATGVSPWRK